MSGHGTPARGYTRREALKLARALGLGALAFAAGCSTEDPVDQATATPTGAPTASPAGGGATEATAGGGILQFASEWFYPADSLDPGTLSENGEIVISGMLFQGLTALDYDWQPTPLLAESWETNDDFTEWTFHLREATFHDGSPLTAQDVAFTLGRLVDESYGSALYSRLEPSLAADGIEVVDDRTVRLTLKRPDSLLLLPLSTYQAFIVRDGAEGANDGIGTGPFRITSFNPGRSYEFERNPDYWREDRPHLDGVRIIAMPEESPKIQSVLSGESHLADMNYVSVSTVQASDAQLLESDAVHLYNIAMDITQAPFDDIRVRQAVKLAMDRQRVLDVAYSGYAETAHDVPAPDSDPFVPGDLAARERNLERARELLAEAGYPDGIELELQCASDEAQTNFALGVADAVRDAGITIEVSPYPIETYWEEVWLNGPFYVSEWFRRHPVEALSVMCGGDAPWNESNYRDAELDSLIEEALRVSGDEQAEIIGRALTKVADESGLGIPGFRRRLFAAKPGLTGLRHTTFTVISFEDVRLG